MIESYKLCDISMRLADETKRLNMWPFVTKPEGGKATILAQICLTPGVFVLFYIAASLAFCPSILLSF